MTELIFSHHITTKRRRTGGSAACSAAYCLRTKATDPWTGRTVNHGARRKDVLFAVLVGPDGILEQDPIAHFTKVDERETHKWAWVAREGIGSLPSVLSLEQQRELTLGWAQLVARRYRVVLLVVLHRAPPRGDPRNVHLHYLFGTRNLKGVKLRVLDKVTTSKVELVKLRRTFADKTNEALRMAGLEERVDPRSFAERGLNQVPGSHRGQRLTRLLREAAENNDKHYTAIAQNHLPITLIKELGSRSPTDIEIDAIVRAGGVLILLTQPNDYSRECIALLDQLVAKERHDSDVSIIAADLRQTLGESANLTPPTEQDAQVISAAVENPEHPIVSSPSHKPDDTQASPLPTLDVPLPDPEVLVEPPQAETSSDTSRIEPQLPEQSATNTAQTIADPITEAADMPISGPTPHRPKIKTRSAVKPKVAKPTESKPPVSPRAPSIELFVPLNAINYSGDGGPLTEDDRAQIKKARALIAEGHASASDIYLARLKMAERRANSVPPISKEPTEPRDLGFEMT